MQWRSEGPAGPATAGGPAGLKGPARGPPGRSSRRNPLARGPNKLFAGGPENRRYATASMTVVSTQIDPGNPGNPDQWGINNCM